jgi:hypothetical protein
LARAISARAALSFAPRPVAGAASASASRALPRHARALLLFASIATARSAAARQPAALSVRHSASASSNCAGRLAG